GEHHYGRVDMKISNELKQSAIARAKSASRLGDFNIVKKADLDGIKLFLDAPTNGNGAAAWVLLRPSGAEPLLRVYSEPSSPELVRQILDAAEAFVNQDATVTVRG